LVGDGINVTLLIGKTKPLPAPENFISAFRSMEITNSDKGRSGFEITFSAGRSALDSDFFDYEIIKSDLLKPFNRVRILLNIGSSSTVLIDGYITHQELSPSNDPRMTTFSIIGEDVGVLLDLEEKSDTHPALSDDKIVQEIIKTYEKYGLKSEVAEPVLKEEPSVDQEVGSQETTDWRYISCLAHKYDFVFFIEPTGTLGENRAYWGPRDLVAKPQEPLYVNMGPITNVSKIDVRYNAFDPSAVIGTLQVPFTSNNLSLDARESKRRHMSASPAISSQTFKRTTRFRESGVSHISGTLESQAMVEDSVDAVTVSGELDIFKYGGILRAFRRVNLAGVGLKYDGLYYVRSVTHTLRSHEYLQRFVLSREGVDSLSRSIENE
jgi:hypothetical protein